MLREAGGARPITQAVLLMCTCQANYEKLDKEFKAFVNMRAQALHVLVACNKAKLCFLPKRMLLTLQYPMNQF